MLDPASSAIQSKAPFGQSVPRANAARLVAGRGRFTDDVLAPRMVHLAFLRSPIAHGRLRALDAGRAAAMPGVVRVVTGADLAGKFHPFKTVLAHLPHHLSPVQPLLAADEVTWQGEPIAAVAAESRALAEDAVEAIEIEWEALPAVGNPEAALARGAPAAHSTLASNLVFAARFGSGDVDAASAGAAHIVEQRFDFSRLAGVPLEPRSILADYDPAAGTLTVHQSHQSPHLMQLLFARHLGLPAHKVRVIAPDVGGAFGIKLHAYGDEMAAAAISVLLGRPVKYVADRLEAFQSDCHARECIVEGRLAVDRDGRLLALSADVLLGIGPYSIYPRSSLGDGLHAATLPGAAYDLAAFRGDLRVAAQNKVPTGAFRGIGQPLACVVAELLLDRAAAALAIDPAEMRRHNYLKPGQFPAVSKGGLKMNSLSLEPCLDKLLALMDYERLRHEQTELRVRGVHRGIGLATFVEQTAPGAGLYGPGAIPVTSQDCCILRVEPSGAVRCEVGCTDQGQGTATGIAQIVAATLGIPLEDVAVATGDSAGAIGGGAWASRGLSIAGEAAYRAATALRANLLDLAAALLQCRAAELDISGGAVVSAPGGEARMSLAELCATAHFRQDLLPPGIEPVLVASAHFTPRRDPYFVANGIQASHLEIDIETGWIKLLGHWVVEDCGHAVNPMLVDEQIRGGVVQGLGAALFERCLYDREGQLLTSNLADYLVPMAAEMPDIVVAHVTTPQPGTALGVKGVGEAGTIGASAAVWCAVHDALRPFGARPERQPFTPDVILAALGRVPSEDKSIVT
ncbi:MAG TPA: xanthine dehydrogenase family protein molybdopterin-binding subunit [Alphaproteobacteria bacterium]|nr:xanthine dehydrogenase family protein molybdopterin-binding subunit [Alphaproteobacteria bacterium]